VDAPNERSGSTVQRASDLQENLLVDREVAGLWRYADRMEPSSETAQPTYVNGS
jgi:hypothetical protein